MAEKVIAPTTYVVVCAVLIVLTVVTVGISFLHIEGLWHIVLGLTVALCKASLVVQFFMHVIISDRLTWAVVLVSCFWLGILLVLTLSDYFSRDIIPMMPGH
jgi:cytochrome c oxidase subunit 4